MKAILLLALAATASAQTIQVQSLFQPAPLSGIWKHQKGDDPRWADPSFDDSAWQNVKMPERSVNPGDGFSWFRLRLRLPENMPKEPLALMIGGFGLAQAYEVFWNGERIGMLSEPAGNLWTLVPPVPRVFEVRPAVRDVVIAIRLRTVFIPWVYRLDALHRTSWIGTSQPVALLAEAWQSRRIDRVLPQLLIAAALMIPGFFFLLLPLWRRDAPEYYWFGIWLLSTTLGRALGVYPDAFGLQRGLVVSCAIILATGFTVGSWVGVISAIFQRRVTLAAWLAAATGLLVNTAPLILSIGGVSVPEFSRSLAALVVSICLFLVYYELGWQRSRPGERTGAIHIAILGYLATNCLVFTGQLIWRGEIFYVQGNLARTVSLLLFTFAMTILINQRSVRLQRERERLGRELESAAEVQQLLLSSSSGTNSLLDIDPVYLPAQEVGGDFYVVLNHNTLLVGDVSGKGLKAAMQVSATVGALRALHLASPGALLAALNDSLADHTGGGFVTCVCVRFDAQGMTVANAGHIPPYRNGMETEVDSGLPLGVVTGMVYPETTLPFGPGDRVMLLSDGVVEAANAKSELFGFDRTREISMQSAQEIAAVAKAWGQNDDITVVTIGVTQREAQA